jgi:hypothetical protein
MSNPDSFIDEVTEEVRREKVQRFLRRWAWLGVLIVVIVVGGAAYNEWTRARAEARAEAFGDAILAALTASDLAERRAGLAAIEPANDNQVAVLALLSATAIAADGDDEGGRQALLALADVDGIGPTYRHLAILKAILAGGSGDPARDAALLDELAVPGAPYRTLAIEQQALAAVAAGDEATAVTLMRLLSEDAEATEALRRRAQQVIVALGASPDPA